MMVSDSQLPILERAREALKQIVEQEGFLGQGVRVSARPLSPGEAIGTPARRDFPILVGKERMIEAIFCGTRAQAFTDSPGELEGTLAEVLELELSSNQNRAIFVATLNAVLGHLGRVDCTVHCRDDEPEACGEEIADTILERHGLVTVGLIGLNPAIAENLVRVFGPEGVLIADLNPDNIGEDRFGVRVWDGGDRTMELIDRSAVVLVTGTTLQNDTFEGIWSLIHARGKAGYLFGVTGGGVCALNSIPRLCPRSHAGVAPHH